MKRCICVMLSAAVLLLCLAGCGESGSTEGYELKTESTLSGQPQSLEPLSEKQLLCKNEKFALYYINGGVVVESVENPAIQWKSAVDETVYDGFAASTETWKNYMQSLAAVTYIAKDDTAGNFSTDYSAAKNNTTTVQKYGNGVKITVKFAKSAITMSFEITLETMGINIRIPAAEIKEEGEFYLYSVELLPFFDAAPNTNEGYIFYPDGSGALSYFNKTAEKHKYTKQLVLDVYGAIETADYFSEEKNPTAQLPVYGIKNGDRAFLAAVTAGDADTQININAGLNISSVKLNRASFSLIYRRKYTVLLSELKKSGDTAEEKSSVRLGEELLGYDREVKLFFLAGDSADYSGMANAYRGYLLECGVLDGKTDYDNNSLCLKFFMSTSQNEGAYKRLVEMTDFAAVESILGEYGKNGVKNITAVLRGWHTGGWGDNISGFSPESALGGKKGLESLDGFAGKNGIRLMLEADNLNVYDGTGLFIKGKDTVTDGVGSPVTDKEEYSFLLNVDKVKGNFEKVLKTAGDYKNITVLNNGLAGLIYSDLNSSNAYGRAETRSAFEEMLKNSGNAVCTGNLYALPYADFVVDCAGSTSNSFIEDTPVPFYQMILHGSAVYCTDTGNSSYDLDYQKLKWIEYGAVPYFELTAENPRLLRDTAYTQLFSSQNSEWQDRIITLYKELEQRLGAVTDGFITEHRIIAENIVAVTYNAENTVYINYSDTEYSIGELSVPPMDYLVITGE